MKTLALLWASAPKCASCEKPFSSDNLDALFTRNFRRGALRLQIIQNLQEQEMSLLPETSEFIAVKAAEDEFRMSVALLRAVNLEFEHNPLIDLNVHTARLAEIQSRIRSVGLHSLIEKKADGIATKSVKCPFKVGSPQECRGYIISGGSCVLCKTKLCKDCNAILTEGHVCLEDDLVNWALIKDTTVGCPRCGTRIQKISGCNQMWCTVKDCNTAFDWATGKIVNGPVHNPHYHQWLALGGGGGLGPENVDIACAGPRGVITNQRIRRFYVIMNPVVDLSRNVNKSKGPIVYFAGQLQVDTEVSVCFATATHYIRCMAEAVDLNHQFEPYGPLTHRDLRIDFLKNKITKAQWASKMSHRETIRQKQAKTRELHVMFQSACADIFARLFTDSEKLNLTLYLSNDVKFNDYLNVLNTFIAAAEGLRVYYNVQLRRILSDYSDKGARLLEFQKPGVPSTLSWYYQNI